MQSEKIRIHALSKLYALVWVFVKALEYCHKKGNTEIFNEPPVE